MKYNYTIYIKCDTNDGDYIEKTTVVSEEKFGEIEKYLRVIITEPIPEYYGNGEVARKDIYDWLEEQTGDYSDNISDIMWEYMPSFVNDYGWHSVVDVKITRIPEDIIPELIGELHTRTFKL